MFEKFETVYGFVFQKSKVFCGKKAKGNQKAIKRMDKVQKSSKDSYNIK